MNRRLKDFYDREYPQREVKRTFELDLILRRRAEYTSYILKRLKATHCINSVLDVGAADGKVAKFIKSQTGLEITLLDISKTLLARSGSFKYKIIGDAQNLPFKSNSFDVVYSLQVLEHIPKWERALDEIIRVSKKICNSKHRCLHIRDISFPARVKC